MSRLNYEYRIVLFLDILAFTDLIDKSIKSNNESIEITDRILNTLKLIDEKLKIGSKFSSREITQFSDSIIVSFKLNDHFELHNYFYKVCYVLAILLKNNFIFRGAISSGWLYHKDNLIFGPALIEAYKLESNCAIYPRVILQKELYELLVRNYSLNFTNLERERLYRNNQIVLLKSDFDSFLYIDYFQTYTMYYREKEIIEIDAFLRNLIEEGIKTLDIKIKPKYEWMKTKYNEMVDTVQELFIEELNLFESRPDIKTWYNNLKTID